MVKSPAEIECIRRSVGTNSRAFERAVARLRPVQVEKRRIGMAQMKHAIGRRREAIDRRRQLEIARNALTLPVAVANGLRSLRPVDFGRQRSLARFLPALFRFRQRALRRRRELGFL